MAEKVLYNEILSRVSAGFPGIYIQTHEEQRVLSDLLKACDAMSYNLFSWSCARGLEQLAECFKKQDGTMALKLPEKRQVIPETGNPIEVMEKLLSDHNMIKKCSIVNLRLFHHFLEDPAVQTYLLDILNEFKKSEKCLVITTPVVKIPPELEKYFSIVECPLPNKEILNECLTGIIEGTDEKVANSLGPDIKNKILDAAAGMTLPEAENAFALALIKAKGDGLVDVISQEKSQLVKKDGILEIMDMNEYGMQQIGGLANLKTWIGRRKRVFSPEAKAFGLPKSKGILLVGPSGSGKSLAAKTLAHELGIPLVRFDIGRVFGSLVGQSEAGMRNALATAEAMAPIVLFVDEIDKGLSGTGGGELDGGTTKRVIGTLLTWMQECKAPVFIVATANDVTGLPPELLRKGRFDEIFSVMLPNAEERREIFMIHMKKRNREKLLGPAPKIDLDYFVDKTEGFSGAEIEMAIVDAMHTAFDSDRELNSADLEDAIKQSRPLSVTMHEKISAMIEWCRDRTRSANAEPAKVAQAKPLPADGKTPSALEFATAMTGGRKIKAS